MQVFSRKDNNLNETWIVLEEAEKMTEEKKTLMVKRKAKKN